MKVLRNNSGVSLIFVLAVMLMLMAIGVSAITAAGFSHGASVARHSNNQLDLYVSSMERTIKAALATDTAGKPLTDTQSLGGTILCDAYRSNPGQHTLSYTITPSIPDDLGVTYTIDITAEMNVEIFYPVVDTLWAETTQSEPENPDGSIARYREIIDWTPQTAMISGEITVTQTTAYNPATLIDNPLSKTTKTTYRYIGGYIEELEGNNIPNTDVDDLSMVIKNPGEWTVIRHE